METQKRRTVGFVPYRKTDTGYEFFLQKRDMQAPTAAGLFGTFGGGIDSGETKEEALLRETMEELQYVPRTYAFFGIVEDVWSLRSVYAEEVDTDFESGVRVLEGEYGKFLTYDQVMQDPDVDQTAAQAVDLIHKAIQAP